MSASAFEQKEQSPMVDDSCHDHQNCWECKQNELKLKKLRGLTQEIKLETAANVLLCRQLKEIDDEIDETTKAIESLKLKINEINDQIHRIKNLNRITVNRLSLV